MSYFVYILQSKKDGWHYTGSTKNLHERIRRHNHGETKSIRHRIPFELIYFEEYPTLSEARKREKYFKSKEGNNERHKLIASFPEERLLNYKCTERGAAR